MIDSNHCVQVLSLYYHIIKQNPVVWLKIVSFQLNRHAAQLFVQKIVYFALGKRLLDNGQLASKNQHLRIC